MGHQGYSARSVRAPHFARHMTGLGLGNKKRTVPDRPRYKHDKGVFSSSLALALSSAAPSSIHVLCGESERLRTQTPWTCHSCVTTGPRPGLLGEVRAMAETEEGQVSHFEGDLARKTTILKRWKTEYFSLRQDMYHRGADLVRSGKTMYPVENGQFTVAASSADPSSPDFLGFELSVSPPYGQPKTTYFRARDAAALRSWLQALGQRGAGISSPNAGSEAPDGVRISHHSPSPLPNSSMRVSSTPNLQLPNPCSVPSRKMSPNRPLSLLVVLLNAPVSMYPRIPSIYLVLTLCC